MAARCSESPVKLHQAAPQCLSPGKQVLKQLQPASLLSLQFWQMPQVETSLFWSTCDFAKESYWRCHNAQKSTAVVSRVRQKAHLAQCPLAGSANIMCLQKMSRRKGNKASLLDIPSRNSSLQQVWLDWLSQRLYLNNYLKEPFLFCEFVFVFVLCYIPWQQMQQLTAWHVRTLPPFSLKTMSGNFDKFVSPGRVRLC